MLFKPMVNISFKIFEFRNENVIDSVDIVIVPILVDSIGNLVVFDMNNSLDGNLESLEADNGCPNAPKQIHHHSSAFRTYFVVFLDFRQGVFSIPYFPE